ncbi:MAG: phosphoribosyltransferase [Deltaproteobacteria bacterium]|nr:phosphoribosyltransferase [Deltaproteobacteria bacterium]
MEQGQKQAMLEFSDAPKVRAGDLLYPGTKIIIRAHNRAFLGCFSLRMRTQINWTVFTAWKEDPAQYTKVADLIAGEISGKVQNNYDVITTAPPSRKRDLNNYSAFELVKAVSAKTGLPFKAAFRQRDKEGHGRFKSTQQGTTVFCNDWDIEDSSVLWIDDFINTGSTASMCFNLLVAKGNHVDGLVWCMGGN